MAIPDKSGESWNRPIGRQEFRPDSVSPQTRAQSGIQAHLLDQNVSTNSETGDMDHLLDHLFKRNMAKVALGAAVVHWAELTNIPREAGVLWAELSPSS